MRPSARCFPNTVVFRTGNSAGTALRCNVQDRDTQRVVRIGGLHPEATAVIYFPAFPLDTSQGARAATAKNILGPECNADDPFTWATPDGPARGFKALGRCRQVSGRRKIFAVDVKDRG